jgi:sugar lactone lactonase YvrE
MKLLLSLLAFSALVVCQNASLAQDNTIATDGLIVGNDTSRFSTILRVDNGTYGNPIEEVHYYYNYWPIGIAVSSTSRIFVCYTRGTYDYTVSEVSSKTTESPYPAGLNLNVSSLNTTFNGIDFGSANSTGLISVQALYITPATSNGDRPETLWLLDTGRPTIQSSDGSFSMPYAQPGGPKVIGVSLSNNSVYATYTFPPTVHYPDSYMNDIRFDLRPNVSTAYIVDSSNEGRPGFIMLNLTTGTSWRRLTQHPSVLRVPGTVPSYQGHPFYYRNPSTPLSHQQEGLDGIQITPDGSHIYYSPLTGQSLYRIPTANLLTPPSDPLAEQSASNNVTWLGQRGGEANGFEGDDHGRIYMLMPTHNAIYYYDPADLQVHGFVRDPRILWPDSASIGADGYFYMNINQLPYQPEWNNGVDLRVQPGAILRAKLPGNATKIGSLY